MQSKSKKTRKKTIVERKSKSLDSLHSGGKESLQISPFLPMFLLFPVFPPLFPIAPIHTGKKEK